MKISFNGKETVNAPVSKVSEFVSNPDKVASCIPDSSEFKRLGERSFSIKVSVGVGTIKGTFSISGSFETTGDNQFVYSLSGAGFGNKVAIKLAVMLEPLGSTTLLDWNADFDISGIISGLGAGIIRKVSEEKIGIIISNAKKALESET
jgi:hypothetical protein